MVRQASLTEIPPEVINLISLHLSQCDLKMLRLTCSLLSDRFQPRLSRLFLSANPLNVEVFLAVASHETFRLGVHEIIWDDALLDTHQQILGLNAEASEKPYPISGALGPDQCEHKESTDSVTVPFWFGHRCDQDMRLLGCQKHYEIATVQQLERTAETDHALPLWRSWLIYKSLFAQQEEVIATDRDIEAFRYGLARLPNLRRITVTPAAHGWPKQALYPTPMIRALPYGLQYPSPRGWPTYLIDSHSALARPWCVNEQRFRGVSTIVRELARAESHDIRELIVDAHHLSTGLNCNLFDCNPTGSLLCQGPPHRNKASESAYRDLVALLGQPGFSRIDLDLQVLDQGSADWSAFRSGALRQALGEAKDLQHVSLRTNAGKWQLFATQFAADHRKMAHHVPLKSIFPVEKWRRLEYFGLSGFFITCADAVSFLAELPPTVRSVDLSFLEFLDGADYRALLEAMRRTLPWADGPESQQPRVCITVAIMNDPSEARGLCVDNEVNEFLYRDGENPFQLEGPLPSCIVPFGKGTVVDYFDPTFARPWLSFDELVERGIYRRPSHHALNPEPDPDNESFDFNAAFETA